MSFFLLIFDCKVWCCFTFAGKNESINRRRRAAVPVLEKRDLRNKNNVDDDDKNDDKDNEDVDNSDDDDDDFEDPSEKTEAFLKSEQLSMLMAREDGTTLSLLGHRFEDMVLSCTYRGISCR